MEINAQGVIDKLTNKVAGLTRDLIIAEAQIEALQQEMAAQSVSREPIDGELIGD